MIAVVPALPPRAVPILSGFDYVAVDAKRRRVFAAHSGSSALVVVDGDTGAVLGQIDVGGQMSGVAVDPVTGMVYTGDGTGRTVSKVDPKALKVVASVAVDGPVDATAYDAKLGRVYADEDNGTRIFVIDAKTMRHVGNVALPGHKPEYLAIDPKTHDVYQNIADRNEIAVIDPKTLRVTRTIATPGIVNNHPLQFDASYNQIVVAGKNGVMAAYSPQGTLLGRTTVEPGIDQCSLESVTHTLACAGDDGIEVLRLQRGGAPQAIGHRKVDPDVHTVGIDPKTMRLWIVWAAKKGDFVQALRLSR
ncbi:MAG: YncE family protein [Candidatus Eremiobacteraeota bacterium]|nr:YncE family protein [Candidatus Eremiobacteraeota bacterium]